jgi:hypothetical protein
MTNDSLDGRDGFGSGGDRTGCGAGEHCCRELWVVKLEVQLKRFRCFVG